MSLWLTYGLLGAVAGPVVIAQGGSVVRSEPLSWFHTAKTEWAAMLATGGLLSGTLVLVAWRLPAVAGAVSWLLIMGLLLSFIDWACHRLPHTLVAVLMAGGLIQCGLTAFSQPGSTGRLFRGTGATVLVFAIALMILLATPHGFGAGDVTLSATVAFFLGWFSWWHVVTGPVLAFTLGALAIGILRVRNPSARGLMIPFGPALVFASVGVVVLTEHKPA
ncbi:prepilin peptidase [Lentzea sp. E54]|uniref:prepilin peptidase n=1 Tax=Lentzea xerophila TaxID=3435883 RepID=UPI003DA57732